MTHSERKDIEILLTERNGGQGAMIGYIDEGFRQFFHKLLSVTNSTMGHELLNLEETLKNYFFNSITVRLRNELSFACVKALNDQNKAEFVEQRIGVYMQELLFFAGITFNVFTGNQVGTPVETTPQITQSTKQ